MLVSSSSSGRAQVKFDQTYGLQEEPPELRGLLFQQNQDGSVRLLRRSGETDPDTPPDIPEEALVGDRVFISVDGISQDWRRHREQISEWFHAGSDYATSVKGPVIGIHEGEGPSALHDVLRVLKDTLLTKGLQSGLLKLRQARERAYANDPSVKTIYDQLKQSLRVGRQVTLMVHSGGAAQAALALALLGAESGGRWRPRIAESVRVLGTAPAAHRRDFEWAGVRGEEIMVTGSRRDPVYGFYSHHVDPKRPWSLLPFLGGGALTSLKFAFHSGPFHQGEYIFSANKGPEGHAIQQFLDGGQGSDRELP